ncbi:MAG TPA: hypothetical protein VKY33_05530 [Flavobacterium sp.]|nr:hypothetical protein [Flavobacterium sp.]
MEATEYFLLNKLDLSLIHRKTAGELIRNSRMQPDALIRVINAANAKQKTRLLCFCDTFSRIYPEYFSTQLHVFVEWTTNETHETNKRSLTNIFLTFLKSKEYSFTIDQENQIIEVCFSWLIDDSLVATKSNCISCLALLAKNHHWIKEALLPLIEQMYPQMPVSFQSRAREILKKIK